MSRPGHSQHGSYPFRPLARSRVAGQRSGDLEAVMVPGDLGARTGRFDPSSTVPGIGPHVSGSSGVVDSGGPVPPEQVAARHASDLAHAGRDDPRSRLLQLPRAHAAPGVGESPRCARTRRRRVGRRDPRSRPAAGDRDRTSGEAVHRAAERDGGRCGRRLPSGRRRPPVAVRRAEEVLAP